MDYTIKEAVLQGKRIYFEQDFPPEVLKKRVRLQSLIKQFKEKGIQAKCRFPAQLRIDLESGTKTFPTLRDVVQTLERLGVSVKMNERERRWRQSSPERPGVRESTTGDMEKGVFPMRI